MLLHNTIYLAPNSINIHGICDSSNPYPLYSLYESKEQRSPFSNEHRYRKSMFYELAIVYNNSEAFCI